MTHIKGIVLKIRNCRRHLRELITFGKKYKMLLKIFSIFSNLGALISSKTAKALYLVIVIKAKKANFLQVHITPLHHMPWLSHQINHSLPSFRCVGCYIIAIFLHIWWLCFCCLTRWPVSPKNLKVRWTSVIKSTNKTFYIKKQQICGAFFWGISQTNQKLYVYFSFGLS